MFPVAGVAGAVAVDGIVTLMQSWSVPPAGMGRFTPGKGFDGNNPDTVLTAGPEQSEFP